MGVVCPFSPMRLQCRHVLLGLATGWTPSTGEYAGRKCSAKFSVLRAWTGLQKCHPDPVQAIVCSTHQVDHLELHCA